MLGVIYKVTCLVTNKSYVGQTIQDLDYYIKHHHFYYALKGEGKTRPFYKAIRKYGPSNFTWLVVTECDTREQLNEQEKNSINHFDTIKNGYNILESQPPSFMDRKHSIQVKKKLSETRKALWNDPDWRSNQIKKYNSRPRIGSEMIIISPQGENFNLSIGFQKFCEQHNLPFTTMRSWVNKGPIEFKRHVRNPLTRNAEGWVKSKSRYYS